MTDRPGGYSVPNPRAKPSGRQEALTGPTPRPSGSGRFSQVGADLSQLEELIREHQVATENRLALRLETVLKAQESAELTMSRRREKAAEADRDDAERRAFRSKVWTLFSGCVALAMTAAMGFALRQARDLFRDDIQAATVEAVAPAVAPTLEPIADRLGESEDRIDKLDGRLSRLEGGMTRVLELLEPATEVHVPQARKRPR